MQCIYHRGVGEGGWGLFLKACPPDPPRRGRATHAPFLTHPPSSQLAPTPLYQVQTSLAHVETHTKKTGHMKVASFDLK